MPNQMVGQIKVHTFPLPRKGFDPLTASSQELKRYGFPRRPDPVQTPIVAAMWVRMLRRYPNFQHITPEFEEMKQQHGPNRRKEKGTEATVNALSSNWSGSVLFIGSGDKFSGIVGSWTVPHVYPTPGSAGTEYSLAWLGIDGDGSPDVMQAGTETNSDGHCYAWFEWYHDYQKKIKNFPVSPGDVVFLVLCALSSTEALYGIINLTSEFVTGCTFSAPEGTTLVGNCAEAIVERPTVNGNLAELPRYGEVFFDDTTAFSAQGMEYKIGLGTAVSMVADDGVTVISAPTFEADTDAFKVSYVGP
jgi:hypothetical protein